MQKSHYCTKQGVNHEEFSHFCEKQNIHWEFNVIELRMVLDFLYKDLHLCSYGRKNVCSEIKPWFVCRTMVKCTIQEKPFTLSWCDGIIMIHKSLHTQLNTLSISISSRISFSWEALPLQKLTGNLNDFFLMYLAKLGWTNLLHTNL